MNEFDTLVNNAAFHLGTEFCRHVIEKHNAEVTAALNRGGCGGYRLDDLPNDTYHEIIDRYREKFAAEMPCEDQAEFYYLPDRDIIEMIENCEHVTRWELNGVPYNT